MFDFLRRRRRRRLRARPFPELWIRYLDHYLPFYRRYDEARREAFRERLKVFVWEKHFIGASGFTVTDEMKVVIAGAAVRLVEKLGLSYYDRLREIVVYPHDYVHPEGRGVILGEAHNWGVVVLSWPAVVRGLRNPCDGWDTASHEFAHVLDRGGGAFNGTPVLRADDHYRSWARVMSTHFRALQDGGPRERAVMRDYGATNEAEFFAVATEAFFEKPHLMRQLTPRLFGELQQFYGIDPTRDADC